MKFSGRQNTQYYTPFVLALPTELRLQHGRDISTRILVHNFCQQVTCQVAIQTYETSILLREI